MVKQTHSDLYTGIQTDGCLFMVDLSIGNDIAIRHGWQPNIMTPEEINIAHDYAVPLWMNDHGTVEKNRCYINDHVEIIELGLRIMGFRDFTVNYAYREDYGRLRMGDPSILKHCNYFVKRIRKPQSDITHFLRCDIHGNTLYNPGVSDAKNYDSFRGFIVRVSIPNGDYFI